VLLSLIEPYRKEDQDKVQDCLKKQGGLDRCSLTFYQEGDTGDDGEWDNWRLEGPAFVWYFRGSPTSTSGSTSPMTPRYRSIPRTSNALQRELRGNSSPGAAAPGLLLLRAPGAIATSPGPAY
jgi:hypothetical protein